MTAMLLFICFATLIKSTPILRRMFLSEKKGFWGTFYKASVVGSRLHWLVSASCFGMAIYLLVLQ
jgi:phage gp46-like protein